MSVSQLWTVSIMFIESFINLAPYQIRIRQIGTSDDFHIRFQRSDYLILITIFIINFRCTDENDQMISLLPVVFSIFHNNCEQILLKSHSETLLSFFHRIEFQVANDIICHYGQCRCPKWMFDFSMSCLLFKMLIICCYFCINWFSLVTSNVICLIVTFLLPNSFNYLE